MHSVLFDFGGTLDADGATWLDRFHPIYTEMGIRTPKEIFARAFYASDDALPNRFALKNLSLEETLQYQVGLVIEALAPERSSLRDKIAQRFLAGCRTQFQRNRPLLERLGRRYRLGIVSNFYGNLESVLKSEGLRDLFETVVDSGVVGQSKPDAGIFWHALKALGASPADCLMVGDSTARDMRGAENMGMAHAKLGPDHEPPCCPSSWRLNTLSDLEPLLT